MNPNASKQKLSGGFSYPLKRSVLDAALESAQLSELPLIQLYRQRLNIVIWAWYPGDSKREVYSAGCGRIQLFIYAVPSTQRHVVEQMIIVQALPSLCSWLREAENAGNVWRATEQHFHCQVINGELKISYD